MKEILWFGAVIFIANIIQGITGFAGTILAMPPSLMLVGYTTAKPILNVLGLLSGVYVFIGNRNNVSFVELKRTVLFMGTGIFIGIFVKGFLAGREHILYTLLGIFVILIAIQGLYSQLFIKKTSKEKKYAILLLPVAGIVHGIFVSGGPLLIGYLSERLKDKTIFRATVSTVWIILNGLILCDDICLGLWDLHQIKILFITIPCLLGGMKLGSIMYGSMSQKTFMRLTYILLLCSGFLLLFK